MTFISNWRRTLRRSAAVLLAYFSTIFYGVGGALFVFADELGDRWFFSLDVACFVIAGGCTAIIPLARIVKQPKLKEGDDADAE
jgi:hypothetical protein